MVGKFFFDCFILYSIIYSNFVCHLIGTGGTAIYALLCARKNNWRMHATDVVEESIEFAKKNVERNGLGELVTGKVGIESVKCQVVKVYLLFSSIDTRDTIEQLLC